MPSAVAFALGIEATLANAITPKSAISDSNLPMILSPNSVTFLISLQSAVRKDADRKDRAKLTVITIGAPSQHTVRSNILTLNKKYRSTTFICAAKIIALHY